MNKQLLADLLRELLEGDESIEPLPTKFELPTFRALQGEITDLRTEVRRLNAALNEEKHRDANAEEVRLKTLERLEQIKDEQAAEIKGLKALLEAGKKYALTCVWCQAESSSLSDLKGHTKICPEHPVAAANKRIEQLQRFKDFVHSWLDSRGVPADPDPQKCIETGCRISCRLNWLFDRMRTQVPIKPVAGNEYAG